MLKANRAHISFHAYCDIDQKISTSTKNSDNFTITKLENGYLVIGRTHYHHTMPQPKFVIKGVEELETFKLLLTNEVPYFDGQAKAQTRLYGSFLCIEGEDGVASVLYLANWKAPTRINIGLYVATEIALTILDKEEVAELISLLNTSFPA
jgi:hypothetical protein